MKTHGANGIWAGLLRALDLGFVSVAGITALFTSLLLYRSETNHPVFNRWSFPFAAFAVVVGVLWLVLTLRAMKRARLGTSSSRVAGVGARLLEVATFGWGIAYLLSALANPDNAGRALDFDFLGSIKPGAAFLEWLAVLFVLIAAIVTMAPRFGRKRAELGLLIATVCALLLLLEGAARAKAFLFAAPQGFPTNSARIWTERYTHLNHLGFRDTDHAVDNASDQHRLLVIGDSYAFGVGINHPSARFGERLAARLSSATGQNWESINASRGDTHTLDHIGFLERTVIFKPDVIVLLYAFNDIHYIKPMTRRGLLTDVGSSPFARLHPARLLFLNSFAFQELFVRARQFMFRRAPSVDAYSDSTSLDSHFKDVKRLSDIAQRSGAKFAVVPFDIAVLTGPAMRDRYARFVSRAQAFGIPVLPIDSAFRGEVYGALIVNSLDHHPNERAHDLAAQAASARVLQALDAQRSSQSPVDNHLR